MAKDYRQIMRWEAAKLTAKAMLSLDHPTAKGDGSEHLVRKFLSKRIGSSFGIAKAEVIDSLGRTTGEYDAVIYDKRTAAAVVAEAGRKAVRVEAVVATVEVKSDLRAADMEDMFKHGNNELMQLTRFFTPSMFLNVLGPRTPDWAKTEVVFRDGLSAMMHHQNIPEVVSFAFGFQGLTKERAADALQSPGVDAVCVLGEYTGAKSKLGFTANPPDLELWSEGDDALGAFLFLVEEALDNYLEARRWVSPHWRRCFLSPELLRPSGRAT
jgi:hypothetical protein